jgi:CheY-like chemotaxis protein
MPGTIEVLLIEDDEIDRQLVEELLVVKGRGTLHLTVAADLNAGLEQLDRRRFDLILLDTKMPQVSALHALRSVGEHAPLTPILPHPPFITVAARKSARERGAFDAVVRGELNPMWSAVTKLLALGGHGGGSEAA